MKLTTVLASASVAAVLFLLPANALAQDAHELRLSWKPTVGGTSTSSSDDRRKQAQTISAGGQVVQDVKQELRFVFEDSREVLAVDGDEITKEKRTFSKARMTKDGGAETTLGFEGKTVIGTRAGEAPWTFAYEDGTPVARQDAEGVSAAFGGRQKEEENPFKPDRPVKVGETWSPDLKKIMEGFTGGAAPEKVEGSGECKLVSAEMREGVLYGKVEGWVKVPFGSMGPVELDTPAQVEIKFAMEGCLDGSRPESQFEMSMTIKGDSGANTPQGKVQIKMDMDMGQTQTMKPGS